MTDGKITTMAGSIITRTTLGTMIAAPFVEDGTETLDNDFIKDEIYQYSLSTIL